MTVSVGQGSVRERAARLQKACAAMGLRTSRIRRLTCWVLAESDDHPDAIAIHRRVQWLDKGVSLATVYRCLRQMADAGVIARRDFGGPRSRFEDFARGDHGHLIDISSGDVFEFEDQTIEARLRRTAEDLGYRMTGWRVEIYAEGGDPARMSVPDTEQSCKSEHSATRCGPGPGPVRSGAADAKLTLPADNVMVSE